ncbi:MAG: LytTR family DNA-binding domain-containing protein [bacterium]
MKVRVEEIAGIPETEIVVRCPHRDDAIELVLQTLGIFEQVVIGKKDGRSYRLAPAEVYYFESVDDKVFACLDREVYETGMRLYEIENLFGGTSFLRVNKNTIVDVAKIVSFKSSLNGRMEARLRNGEAIEVSRSYVAAIKWMLGGATK